jgi:hypothetical protein
MSNRTLKIVDGPSFRGFAIESGIVSELSCDQVFTMDRMLPLGCTSIHKNRAKFQTQLDVFGREDEKNPNLFNFIAHIHGNLNTAIPHIWLYVGIYNTQKREGMCEEIHSKKFFKKRVMRLLFPQLAEKFG